MLALMHAMAVVEWLGINGLTVTISVLVLAIGSYFVSTINYVQAFKFHCFCMVLADHHVVLICFRLSCGFFIDSLP